jgi:hypothetical protein
MGGRMCILEMGIVHIEEGAWGMNTIVPNFHDLV